MVKAAAVRKVQNGYHAVEDLYPLFPFTSLTAHIIHTESNLLTGVWDIKLYVLDGCSDYSTPQNVLIGRYVVRFSNLWHLVEEVFGTVYELVLVGSVVTFLDSLIRPQSFDVVPKLLCGFTFWISSVSKDVI